MTGFEKQTYTQVPNSLFDVMNEMDECELKVVLYICRYTFGYHREEVKISTRKLAKAIKMSVASVDKGANAAVDRGLIERITDGQNTTLWRAVVSDSEFESLESDTKNETLVTQKVNHADSENESQVGTKERKRKITKKIINHQALSLFTSKLGKFKSEREVERWVILYDSVGAERALELIIWAVKKEIHLSNRPSLIDSLETAAKRWQSHPGKRQTAAEVAANTGDRSRYTSGQYADFLA